MVKPKYKTWGLRYKKITERNYYCNANITRYNNPLNKEKDLRAVKNSKLIFRQGL